MTLLVTILKNNETIQLADRKISGVSGTKFEDINKITYVVANDGQALLAYTGLAEVGNFKTSEWLLEALSACKGNGDIENAAFSLADYASREFYSHPSLSKCSPAEKRLTIIGSGHGHDGTSLFFRVSNFVSAKGLVSNTASENFDLLPQNKKQTKQQYLIYWDGYIDHVTRKDFDPVQVLIAENRPKKAIIGKAVSIMRDICRREDTSKFVGTDISVARLQCAPRSGPICSYYPHSKANEIPLSANLVDIRETSSGILIRDPKIEGVEVVSPNTPRNAPCPCGSRKKYKVCCGRK